MCICIDHPRLPNISSGFSMFISGWALPIPDHPEECLRWGWWGPRAGRRRGCSEGSLTFGWGLGWSGFRLLAVCNRMCQAKHDHCPLLLQGSPSTSRHHVKSPTSKHNLHLSSKCYHDKREHCRPQPHPPATTKTTRGWLLSTINMFWQYKEVVSPTQTAKAIYNRHETHNRQVVKDFCRLWWQKSHPEDPIPWLNKQCNCPFET